jgi:hypothetical protein
MQSIKVSLAESSLLEVGINHTHKKKKLLRSSPTFNQILQRVAKQILGNPKNILNNTKIT